ncbi:MAG: hypothetical protein AAFX99_23280 [Myxococcota bacterium]
MMLGYLLLTLTGSPALAQEVTSPSTVRAEQIPKRSAEHRQDKTLALTLEADYLAPAIDPSLSVGYFLTPDLILELEGVWMRASNDVVLSTVRKTSGGFSLAARARWFVANTFHLQGGFRWRHYDATDGGTAGINDALGNPSVPSYTVVSSRYVVNDLLLELGIANRWQWSNFHLGVTWLALGFPIAILKSTEQLYDQSTGEYVQDGVTNIDRVPWDVRFMSVQLGASF